jgi:hypothetical protein
MVTLNDTQKSQVKFHLAYNLATPATDRARLERSCNEIDSTWTVTRITDLITRCENAYTATAIEEGELAIDEQTEVTGDVVRTTKAKNRDPFNRRQRAYLLETSRLALTLGVRNYRDPEQALRGYLIDGGTYIKSIPGPQGEQGTQGTQGTTGTTGAKGDTGSVEATSALELIEQSSDPAAITGKTLIYARTDHKIYKRIPSGTITELGAGTGSGEAGFNITNTNTTLSAGSFKAITTAIADPLVVDCVNLTTGNYLRWVNKDDNKSIYLKSLTSLDGTTITGSQGVKIDPGNSLEIVIINTNKDTLKLSGTHSIASLPGGTISLTYSSPGDTNGLFYYLGTDGLTTSWSNPTPSKVTFIGNSLYTPSLATNRITNDGADAVQATNPPNFTIDIGTSRILLLNRYTIYCRNNSYRASTWKVEGSNDNGNFTLIHNQSSTFDWGSGTWYTSPNITSDTAYRYFKFTLLTGTNGGGESDINEIELYGDLTP